MTDNFAILLGLLERVASALGDDLLPEVVFVGGCTTGLLITDSAALADVRLTQDVDIIVEITSHLEWHNFQKVLARKGFRVAMDEDVLCRMRLENGIVVDFMPTKEDVLGFTNRWYESAMEHAIEEQLPGGLTIRCLDGPHFLGTKFEAYLGRGHNDPMVSHDIEDILVLLDGRPEMVDEVAGSLPELMLYIAGQMGDLLSHQDFEHVLSGSIADPDRRASVRKRIRQLAG